MDAADLAVQRQEPKKCQHVYKKNGRHEKALMAFPEQEEEKRKKEEGEEEEIHR